MTVLSAAGGYLLIALFGALMIGLTYVLSREERWRHTGVGFQDQLPFERHGAVAGRNHPCLYLPGAVVV